MALVCNQNFLEPGLGVQLYARHHENYRGDKEAVLTLKKKLCTLVEEAFLTLAYGTDGSLGKIMKYKCK